MKRNIDILKFYLDRLDLKNKQKLQVEFNWADEKRYSVLSDAVFITRGKL